MLIIESGLWWSWQPSHPRRTWWASTVCFCHPEMMFNKSGLLIGRICRILRDGRTPNVGGRSTNLSSWFWPGIICWRVLPYVIRDSLAHSCLRAVGSYRRSFYTQKGILCIWVCLGCILLNIRGLRGSKTIWKSWSVNIILYTT